jgi:hypothetical protein
VLRTLTDVKAIVDSPTRPLCLPCTDTQLLLPMQHFLPVLAASDDCTVAVELFGYSRHEVTEVPIQSAQDLHEGLRHCDHCSVCVCGENPPPLARRHLGPPWLLVGHTTTTRL